MANIVKELTELAEKLGVELEDFYSHLRDRFEPRAGLAKTEEPSPNEVTTSAQASEAPTETTSAPTVEVQTNTTEPQTTVAGLQ